MEKGVRFHIDDIVNLRAKMLNWTNRFNIFCFLDNCGYAHTGRDFECLVAAGSKYSLQSAPVDAYHRLAEFLESHPGSWAFGHLGYDLSNPDPKVHAKEVDKTGFDHLFFFIPEVLLKLDATGLIIFSDSDASEIFHSIVNSPDSISDHQHSPVHIKRRINKEEYIRTIRELRDHLLRGDCYEINFCQEFYCEKALIDPLATYAHLTEISPNPFSAFYRINDQYCICASPERFLAKNGEHIISQPIKGTSKRSPHDKLKDEEALQYLRESEKEKSENVMVVDLVRNDLSRVCRAGTVEVDELFGIYRFPQVYQMISTVSGMLKPETGIASILSSCFPMGSMTGAPKTRVIQLISQYEQTRRGLFSGSVGYFKPVVNGDRDFDLNVVIRSMMYNAATGYLSFHTGSGITYNSDPEKEYEECLMKAEAMFAVLR